MLRGGERIKIGRVVFTVKELANDKYKFGCSGAPKIVSEDGSGIEYVSSGHSENVDLLSVTDDGECVHEGTAVKTVSESGSHF